MNTMEWARKIIAMNDEELVETYDRELNNMMFGNFHPVPSEAKRQLDALSQLLDLLAMEKGYRGLI